MIGAIHHLDLKVSDLERSDLLYDRLLTRIGFIRVNLSTPGEPGRLAWIDRSSATQARPCEGLRSKRRKAACDDPLERDRINIARSGFSNRIGL
jgi:hypothetical protein